MCVYILRKYFIIRKNQKYSVSLPLNMITNNYIKILKISFHKSIVQDIAGLDS